MMTTPRGYKRIHKYWGTIQAIVNDVVIFDMVYNGPKQRKKLFERFSAFIRGKENAYIGIVPDWTSLTVI